jgi:hypothetical protein
MEFGLSPAASTFAPLPTLKIVDSPVARNLFISNFNKQSQVSSFLLAQNSIHGFPSPHLEEKSNFPYPTAGNTWRRIRACFKNWPKKSKCAAEAASKNKPSICDDDFIIFYGDPVRDCL